MAPPFMNTTFMISELIFTILVVFFCFLIYFKTRESYILTKHKGLGYFRAAFLFFGLSYVLRFILGAVMLSGFVFNLGFIGGMSSQIFIVPLFIIPLSYFSTVAIVYLLYSSMWKKINTKWVLIMGHVVAILLSFVAFATRSQILLVGLQALLLVIAAIAALVMNKDKNKDKNKKQALNKINSRSNKQLNKSSNMKFIYFLVSSLWLFNLLVLETRMHFPWEIKMACQLVSVLIFSLIYVRLYKWIK
ncbi:MAG: hypothetical protein WC758_04915 [Candidatus Woesearchaeota archaeon]|jgi:hypothetical protein